MEPVVHRNLSASHRLAELRIPEKALRLALEAGDAEARAWTEASPRSMSGMARWGRTNERLRLGLGWEYENPNNLPLTISPDRSFVLFATSGDEWTGFYGSEQPTTKYAKGAATTSAVERNGQLTIDMVDDEVGVALSEAVVSSEHLTTWILLYRVTPDAIYAELSLPESISKKGYIESWRERILLDRYEFDHVSTSDDRRDEGDEGIDVAVERR